MWLLLAFLAIPLIEIGLFIQIGGAIGMPLTLLIVVLTAILGTWLVRSQGILAMGQLRSSFSELRDPTEPLVHGAMILFAGALLLTPGFFTDTIGFALLIPPVRQAVYKTLRSRVEIKSFAPRPPEAGYGHSNSDVLDGEYHDITGDNDQRHTPSGWTKH